MLRFGGEGRYTKCCDFSREGKYTKCCVLEGRENTQSAVFWWGDGWGVGGYTKCCVLEEGGIHKVLCFGGEGKYTKCCFLVGRKNTQSAPFLVGGGGGGRGYMKYCVFSGEGK